MPFVQRDSTNAIVGVFANPQPDFATEFLPDTDPAVVAFVLPPKVQTVVPQDLVDQLTTADAAKIQNALNANSQFWLGWQTLSSIRDPVPVTNARFKKAWTALTQILGAQRMGDIATTLGVTVN